MLSIRWFLYATLFNLTYKPITCYRELFSPFAWSSVFSRNVMKQAKQYLLNRSTANVRICSANQFTGFDMIGTLVFNGLKHLIFVFFTLISSLFSKHWPIFPQILLKYFCDKKSWSSKHYLGLCKLTRKIRTQLFLLSNTEAYLEPSWISTMELFENS